MRGACTTIGFVERLDNIVYDARLSLTMPGRGGPRIVILDIDEKSLGEIGRWPWSRNLMARLVDKLFDRYRIAILGFDVVWAERDTSSGIDTLDMLAQQELKEVRGFQSAYRELRSRLDFDGLFAASLKGRPVVLGYYFSGEDQAVRVNAIPEPVLPKGTFAGREVAFPRWRGYTGNLEICQKNAAGAGHFNPLVDDDGVSRRVPMILEVDQMAADPEKYSMEPRAAELTILFSDVRGFTSISEALKPEQLREYINEYLTSMSQIIRARFHGTLDKYIGDAIMAFWGAPVEDPEHARHGVLAGLAMQKACGALNEKYAARGWPTLKIGVGLNTGSVRVGDMGSQLRRAYTVMGDPVNVASRLEGRTKFYGVGILVGEATQNAVKDVVFREVDRVKVKGKEDAVTIYEPIGLDSEVDRTMRDELELWNQTLQAHRAQQWDRVKVNLLDLQRMRPDCVLYGLYAERAADLRSVPPRQGWNGVATFDEK